MLRKETFEYEGATFYIQGATGLSELDRRALIEQLEGKTGRGEVHNNIYAEIIAQTVSVKNSRKLGFTLPSPVAPIEDHIAAFPLIMGQPVDLVNRWIGAIQAVNTPPNSDPDLQPGVATKDPLSDAPETDNAST